MKKKEEAKFMDAKPTQEWLNLFLSNEITEKCKVVYRKIEGKNRAKFCELWNPDKTYSEDCVIVPVSSTYDGAVEIKAGTSFRNVKGSSKDPNPYKVSWIGLMRVIYDVFNWPMDILNNCCATAAYYNDYTRFSNPHSGDIGGAHVYISQHGNTVFLLPLCQSHNTVQADYYMQTAHKVLAVKLKDCILN